MSHKIALNHVSKFLNISMNPVLTRASIYWLFMLNGVKETEGASSMLSEIMCKMGLGLAFKCTKQINTGDN